MNWWSSLFGSKKPKIELFVRHCHFSTVSQHKKRFPNFSRERCYQNLIETIGEDKRVGVTFLLDTFYPQEGEHFIRKQERFPIVEIKEGTETGSFLKLLEHVKNLKLKPDTIVYFLEDDYLHKPGWVDVLIEGFSIPQASYVTLYDHKDKYFLPSYENLTSRLFHTATCHWRTTPSTTNTYAMRYQTLLDHFDIHREFSLGRKISDDHGKFCKLSAIGAQLISSIPGWSTHAEPEFASPCTPWDQLFN